MPPKIGGPLEGRDDGSEKIMGQGIDREPDPDSGSVHVDHGGLDDPLFVPGAEFQADHVAGDENLMDFEAGPGGAQVVEDTGIPLGGIIVGNVNKFKLKTTVITTGIP